VNENNKALEEKIDLGFNQIKEFVVNSNKQLLEDISLLFAKSGGSSSVIREVKEPSKKHADETFSGGLDFNGGSFIFSVNFCYIHNIILIYSLVFSSS